MRGAVREVFLAVRNGRSPDVVIADPDLNERFLQECRARGLSDPPVVLRNQEDYRFASEIAVRFLERRDQRTLDQILCDPDRAGEFDKIAADLAPGFGRFQYRWAALNLRKRRRLRPELLGRVIPAEAVVTGRVADISLDQLPARSGLYLFLAPSGVLYVGECQNLRKRLGKHLDHSDNKGVAHWLWQHGTGELHVEYHVLPLGVTARVRKAMEAELIQSRRPDFNVAGTER